MNSAAVHTKAIQLSKLAVRMTTLAGSGHPSSSSSLAHIVTLLMYEKMRWDPKNPHRPDCDRLVLSEGHAVPIVYAALADLGAAVAAHPGDVEATSTLTIPELDQLRANDSVLDGHPNPGEGVPFFDAATGSLGMGLSVAAGLALGARHDKTGRRVYCIIGDGESREGQIWEAADFIVDHKLTSVCAIFNANGQGQAAFVSHQQSAEVLMAKLKAYGWEVRGIDGHNPAEVADALNAFGHGDKPFAIVARTIKGWGFDILQKGNWHGKPLSEKEMDAADKSADEYLKKLIGGESPSRIDPPKPPATPAKPLNRAAPNEVAWPAFAEAMAAAGLGEALAKNKLATRRAFGVALKVAGDLIPQVAAIDCDVSNSTFTEIFAKAHPERFFEGKIAEQNMVSAGVGLSAAGMIPFATSFAKFISRAFDQVELASISRANLKIVGSHAGISLAADGPSQMGLLDVPFFRAFSTVRGDDRTNPLCWVYQPADAVGAYYCTRLMTMHHGLCYMRTFRPDVPLLYGPTQGFEPGGFNLLSAGEDMALVSAGYMVHIAKQAAELLSKQNIRAAVIDAYSFPIQGAKFVEALQKCGRRALVVEDNYGGGLGSAVAELAAAHGGLRTETLLCQRLPKSARSPEEILEQCGLSPRHIADYARALLGRVG